MDTKKLIAISGPAQAGKDSLFKAIASIANEFGIKSTQLSFAKQLRTELYPYILKHFGIDIFSATGDQKELIRPIMIHWAKVHRATSNGEYYWRIIEKEYLANPTNSDLSIITDLRHKEFENDELDFVKNHNGIVIYVQKLNKRGKLIKPTIPEEIRFCPIMEANAKYVVNWPDNLNEEERVQFIKETALLKDVLSSYPLVKKL